jgi:hypothetical protein
MVNYSEILDPVALACKILSIKLKRVPEFIQDEF